VLYKPTTSSTDLLQDHGYIFPNPASQEIYSTLPSEEPVEMINIHGQVVKTGRISNEKPFSVSEIEPGIYLIRFAEQGLMQRVVIF
jgi:hypothetical protein